MLMCQDRSISFSMTNEEIKKLAERVAAGLASEEEIRDYSNLYNNFESLGSSQQEVLDTEAIRAEILQAVHARINTKKPVVSISWKRWAAAAILVILAGTVVYFLSVNSGKPSPSLVKKDSSDLKISAPGNKATLTLADGSVVTLDDMKSDTLFQPGGVKVLKLAGGALSYEGNKNQSGITPNTITTPPGGQYRLVLEDGSNVWLNVASSLRFPAVFNGNERVVELNGEAYFEVTKDAKRPFKVKVNDMTVEVLGTHFNINSYHDEKDVRTTLLEGSVKVNAAQKAVMLKPSEQLVFTPASSKVQKLENVNVEDVVAWKEGRFKFQQMPIEAIMRQVARWYNVNVQYDGAITKELFTGDVSRQEDVNQLLDILRATKIVSFQVDGNKITVTSLK